MTVILTRHGCFAPFRYIDIKYVMHSATYIELYSKHMTSDGVKPILFPVDEVVKMEVIP